MGLYVQSFADLPATLGPNWSERFRDIAQGWADRSGLHDLFYASARPDSIWLSFYPPCGGVSFKAERGRVSFDAKTSIAGPGFHAALIDLCDALQTELGVVWRWDAGGDETGFATHRDFTALQLAFVGQFEAFCDFYRQNRGNEKLHALNLSEGMAMDGYTGVATPLGPIPLQFFLDTTPESAPENAQRIFAWWKREIDSEFWERTALAIMWAEVEWRPARGLWEEHVQCAALSSSDNAVALTEDVKAARQELLGIRMQARDDFNRPNAEGIGWTRRLRGYFLPGPWRINLPGYYIDQIEDDGGTTCVWFGDEEVRGTSFTLSLKTPGHLSWSKELSDAPEIRTNSHVFRINPKIKPASAEGSWIAFAECQALASATEGHLLVISLLARSENLLLRLEEIAREVWFNPPQKAPAGPRDA